MMKKQCPYCGKEMKQINSNHLKIHGVTYKEYLKEYDKEKYYEKVIVDFIEEYYKPSAKKYIEQIEHRETRDIRWITMETTTKEKYQILKATAEGKLKKGGIEIDMQKNLRPFPFCKSDLVAHVKKQRTIGVHTQQKDNNRYVTFDIDIFDEEILKRIWETLNIFGIEDNQILASYSGNKGCHMTVFFDEFIVNTIIEAFFNIIVEEANIQQEERENGAPVVELRGTSTYGVKLPFGLNKNNKISYKKVTTYEEWEEVEAKGRGNYCYLINRYMGEIDTVSKLESMKKVSRQLIEEIVADYEVFEPELKEEKVKEFQVPQVEKDFTTLIEEIDISQLTNSKEDIIESLENLLKRDIVEGTRHHTLFKIAIYNKSRGLTPEENESFLLEFSTQSRHTYKATAKQNEVDIHSLIKTIYFSKNCDKYRIKATTKQVFFSREDIQELLSVPDKPLREMYFVLMMHVKMYHLFQIKEEGQLIQFYCGYQRLIKTIGGNGKTINDKLKKLEELGKIEFIRKGQYAHTTCEPGKPYKPLEQRKKEMRYEPNIYQLNYPLKDIKEGYKLLCTASQKDNNVTYVNFQVLCSKIFDKREIATYFKGVEIKNVHKFKHQQTRKIG